MRRSNRKGWRLLLSLNTCNVPHKPGAYVIAASRPINRTVRTDNSGVLDIGEAVDLKKRLATFVACASGRRAKGHSAGVRYYALDLGKAFPIDSLYFQLHATSTKKQAYQTEGRLLSKYVQKYKELPPLNNKFNRAFSELNR